MRFSPTYALRRSAGAFPPQSTIGRSDRLSSKSGAKTPANLPLLLTWVTEREAATANDEVPVSNPHDPPDPRHDSRFAPAPGPDDADVDLIMVTMVFDAADPDALLGVLAKYVVLARGHEGARNIDLAASATSPNRFVIVQKWETPAAQRAHFDSADMVEMAATASPLLTQPPTIDLLDPISAHDLA